MHPDEPDGDQETKVGRVSARAWMELFKIDSLVFKRCM
jgi:hypothetical protein